MPFLVRSPKDVELLGLERGMTIQVSNIMFPEENSGVRCQYSKEWNMMSYLTQKGLEILQILC